MLPLTFIQRVLHEGGHALYVALHGVPTLLYIHPFSNIPGYARPAIDLSVWFIVLGSLTALPLSLLISLPFWKRCSRAFLPLVMLLPYVAIHDGLNITGLLGGDFRNIVQIYGVSPIPFILLGALIFMAGIFLLFAILPLLGLDPGDKRSLFVLPAAMLLVSTLSLVVACLLVPGSPIDREYFLGREILTAANSLLLPQTIFWMILAVFYVTIYRRVHPRLPAWLRSETVQPGWKDLRLPALLAAISVILGLIIIS